jgi:trehalose 6-phosphate phosphatase
MTSTFASPSEILGVTAPLTVDPARAGAFFDLDGTLAPIIDRPEQVAVPWRTRELLARIGERYAIVGIVSGRRAADAKRIVGLERFSYVGNHGFEALLPGRDRAEPAPALAGLEGVAGTFAAGLDRERLDSCGLRLEDKGAIVALHWRGAADPPAAESAVALIAAEAEAAGLNTHRGRMVLELRPRVDVDKGIALAATIGQAGVGVGFYAGDDRTDADAFRALRRMVDLGELERAVCVAVVADETPAEVIESADLAVEGPEGFVAVLEALA